MLCLSFFSCVRLFVSEDNSLKIFYYVIHKRLFLEAVSGIIVISL